jgi:hypothetical protein
MKIAVPLVKVIALILIHKMIMLLLGEQVRYTLADEKYNDSQSLVSTK